MSENVRKPFTHSLACKNLIGHKERQHAMYTTYTLKLLCSHGFKTRYIMTPSDLSCKTHAQNTPHPNFVKVLRVLRDKTLAKSTRCLNKFKVPSLFDLNPWWDESQATFIFFSYPISTYKFTPPLEVRWDTWNPLSILYISLIGFALSSCPFILWYLKHSQAQFWSKEWNTKVLHAYTRSQLIWVKI